MTYITLKVVGYLITVIIVLGDREIHISLSRPELEGLHDIIETYLCNGTINTYKYFDVNLN